MKKLLLAAIIGLSCVSATAFAEPVRDWHDLDEVHKHVVEAIHEMERARAVNHYDMDGHGAKAEDDLRHAEAELHKAIESAKHAR